MCKMPQNDRACRSAAASSAALLLEGEVAVDLSPPLEADRLCFILLQNSRKLGERCGGYSTVYVPCGASRSPIKAG